MEQWKDLAACWGIEPGYYDVQGHYHEADPDVVRKVVTALSASGQRPAAMPHDMPSPAEPAFQGDGRRVWVLAVQLYGVRSARNWGHGDFTDLAALLELVADAGGAGVGLNPLHALFYDWAGSGSPYSPSSRLFLNPLYIDVEAIAEPRDLDDAVHGAIEQLRASELIDYIAVARAKLPVLRSVYRRFAASGSAERRQDFEDYRRERGTPLESFAAFEVLRARHSAPWWDWPDECRKPNQAVLRRLRQEEPDELGFHAFLQWTAERQLKRCNEIARRRGLAIGLYLDTAVGVDPAGADAWTSQQAMLQGLSVGAPPDQFNPAGQDWGLTAYNPHGLVTENFEPFRQMLRAGMRNAGAIRIDHVLGLMRLFVVPRGLGADQGVYLRCPFTAMLNVVREESLRWRCIVIGEDLGTVPENFRETLEAWGAWRYFVMLFERQHDGSFKPPSAYPAKAIATFNTHDLATFAGWMSGHDLAVKRGIGVNPGESDDERQRSREALRAAIAAVTGRDQPKFEDVVAFVAATPTRLVSIAIEDVLELLDQPNVPGTVTEHPNWRRRLPVGVEDVAPRLRRIAEVMAHAGRR